MLIGVALWNANVVNEAMKTEDEAVDGVVLAIVRVATLNETVLEAATGLMDDVTADEVMGVVLPKRLWTVVTNGAEGFVDAKNKKGFSILAALLLVTMPI